MIIYQCSFCKICASDDPICDCKKKKKSQEDLIAEIFGCTLTEVDELPVRKVNDETTTNEKPFKRRTHLLKNSTESKQTQLHLSWT